MMKHYSLWLYVFLFMIALAHSFEGLLQRVLHHDESEQTDVAPGLSSKTFYGLTTYANLPYVDCLGNREIWEPYDIAIIGAPFDTVNIQNARLIAPSLITLLFFV